MRAEYFEPRNSEVKRSRSLGPHKNSTRGSSTRLSQGLPGSFLTNMHSYPLSSRLPVEQTAVEFELRRLRFKLWVPRFVWSLVWNDVENEHLQSSPMKFKHIAKKWFGRSGCSQLVNLHIFREDGRALCYRKTFTYNHCFTHSQAGGLRQRRASPEVLLSAVRKRVKYFQELAPVVSHPVDASPSEMRSGQMTACRFLH